MVNLLVAFGTDKDPLESIHWDFIRIVNSPDALNSSVQGKPANPAESGKGRKAGIPASSAAAESAG